MGRSETLFLGHGIWVLLGLIFAGGLGLPLPAPPILLAAGVLAATLGRAHRRGIPLLANPRSPFWNDDEPNRYAQESAAPSDAWKSSDSTAS